MDAHKPYLNIETTTSYDYNQQVVMYLTKLTRSNYIYPAHPMGSFRIDHLRWCFPLFIKGVCSC